MSGSRYDRGQCNAIDFMKRRREEEEKEKKKKSISCRLTLARKNLIIRQRERKKCQGLSGAVPVSRDDWCITQRFGHLLQSANDARTRARGRTQGCSIYAILMAFKHIIIYEYELNLYCDQLIMLTLLT